MSAPLLTSQRVTFVAGVLLLINSQLPAGCAGQVARPVKPVLDLLLLPVQAPLYSLALSVLEPEPGSERGPDSVEQLRVNYEEGLVTIDALQQQVLELQRRLYLVENVREMTETATRPLSAQVVAQADTGPREVLTLNRGSRHGVGPEMTVVYLSSVVGRVLAPVSGGSSDVELVTAHDAGLQVRIQPRGSQEKYDNIRVSRGEDGRSFVAQVAVNSEIGEGADVLLADSVHYPDARGRLLGVVELVREYPPDPLLQKQLLIRPVHDLRHLREVAVLLPADAAPAENAVR